MDSTEAMRASGRKAVEWIRNGMVVGLGTGRTSAHFIEALGEKVKQGLMIQAVASSRASADLAKRSGIPLTDINDISRVDITVDGADEIDDKKRMIKGGGGALLREKVLASSSIQMIVVVDESKLVECLGKAPLPVEILYYGSPATRMKLEKLGYSGKWRLDSNGALFLTENGNVVFDIHFPKPPVSPEEEDEKILSIPGVIDTGFFFNMAHRVIIGYTDGRTEQLE